MGSRSPQEPQSRARAQSDEFKNGVWTETDQYVCVCLDMTLRFGVRFIAVHFCVVCVWSVVDTPALSARWCAYKAHRRKVHMGTSRGAGVHVGVTGWFEPCLVMLLPRNVTVTLTAMTNLLPHARHRVPLHGEPTHGTHSHCILEPHRRAAPGARGRLPAAPHAPV